MTIPPGASSRRDFLVRGAQLAVLLGVGTPLLQACGGDDDDDAGGNGTSTSGPGTTATGGTGSAPEGAIASGLEPEAGPLRIFNYPDYVATDVVAAFEEK